MELGVGIILTIWLIALLSTERKAEKHYQILEKEKMIGSGLEESKMEVILKYVGVVILIGFVGVVVLGASTGRLNERILLYLVAIYLVTYYIMEYIAHYKWCITKDGLRSSRQLEVIGFEKIVNFTWYERPDKLILRVNYKGRGIVTRKSDYVVPTKMRREVEELLKRKVICTRG